MAPLGAGLRRARARALIATLAVLSADIRPLSIAGGVGAENGGRGIVLDLVRAAAARAGYGVSFAFHPFPEAVARTRATRGTLIAPLGRDASREEAFTWVAPVLDVPQVMGTLGGTLGAPVDLEGARRLARVAVPRGGVQETLLRERGFDNLLPVDDPREAARALAEGRADAWYAAATQIAAEMAAIGEAGRLRLGPAVVTATAWLAASPDPGDLPVGALRGAMAAVLAEGAGERAWRDYVPDAM